MSKLALFRNGKEFFLNIGSRSPQKQVSSKRVLSLPISKKLFKPIEKFMS